MNALTWVLSLALVLTAAAFVRHRLQTQRGAAKLNRTVNLADLEKNSLGSCATPDEEINVPATG